MQSESGVKVHIDRFISIAQEFSSTANKDYLHYLMIINSLHLLLYTQLLVHICITVAFV